MVAAEKEQDCSKYSRFHSRFIEREIFTGAPAFAGRVE
jgi:hypothetical protein